VCIQLAQFACVQNCLSQNVVKFPPTLIIFGTRIARRIGLCEVHLFSTSPYSCQRPTVLNANVPNCRSKAHGGADLSFISPQPDTSLHCQTTNTWLVHRAVCLFTSELSLVLIAPTHGLHGWMVRLFIAMSLNTAAGGTAKNVLVFTATR